MKPQTLWQQDGGHTRRGAVRGTSSGTDAERERGARRHARHDAHRGGERSGGGVGEHEKCEETGKQTEHFLCVCVGDITTIIEVVRRE